LQNLGPPAALQSKLPGVGISAIAAMLDVLDNFGIGTVMPRPRSPTGGVIVLRPQWLARLLSTIVTTKHRWDNDPTSCDARQLGGQHYRS
jgi:hypothetical protein